eukprot:CAMPEP_0181318460 /NCGR_PEP_ID=MMETSP1101-20121128/17015_1 /TAXON_ID=46948 /ORGANISM="Rhodomonas abbreviata, Strain Caron Lab Isolate" /LENGTH=68 /DNA_ID=CAMNT_0023425925 /DNA_START=67 /DNA_END=270 /DNA_ORIENTATION=-
MTPSTTLLVVLLVLLDHLLPAAGDYEHACQWSYNRLHWDLSPLVRHAPAPSYTVHRNAWTFTLNVCAD